MIASITEQNKRFINCLYVLPGFLTLMMICRGILFWLSSGDTDPVFSWKAAMWIFFAGLRFDALILGFIFLPLYFLCWFLNKKGQVIYLTFFWFLIVLINFSNLHFFLKNNSHRYWPDHIAKTYWADLVYWWNHESLVTSVLLILIYILILSIGRKNVLDSIIKEKHTKVMDLEDPIENDDPRRHFEAPFRIAFKTIWPLILIILMARSSVGQHHLRREDSVVTQSTMLNEIVLNPMWTLDKVKP